MGRVTLSSGKGKFKSQPRNGLVIRGIGKGSQFVIHSGKNNQIVGSASDRVPPKRKEQHMGMPWDTHMRMLFRSNQSARRHAILLAGVVLLLLSACSSTPGSSAASPDATRTSPPTSLPTATSVPTSTSTTVVPTPMSSVCSSKYSSGYVVFLPDADSPITTVYDVVALPPGTRYYDDDATGLRVRFMCSDSPTGEVFEFMPGHLSSQGWTMLPAVTDCGAAVIPGYGQQTCWQILGKYRLYVGLNSNTDWVVAFIDPAFVS